MDRQEMRFEDPCGFYGALGCTPAHSLSVIIGEYRHRACMLHPDKQLPGNEQGDLKMAALNEAYAVLGSPRRRACYDAYRQAGLDIPWLDWEQRQSEDHLGPSMHWRNRDPQPSIVAPLDISESGDGGGELQRRFRHYQI